MGRRTTSIPTRRPWDATTWSRSPTGPAYELKYDSPAKVWEEAHPLGSGFVGAMVWGGTSHETVDLNEDTVWSGSPNSNVKPGATVRPKTAESGADAARREWPSTCGQTTADSL